MAIKYNPATYLQDKRNRRSMARALVIDGKGKPASTVIPWANPLDNSEWGWLCGAPPDGEIGNYRQADGSILKQEVRFCWMSFHPLELQSLVGDGDEETGDLEIHSFRGDGSHVESFSIDLDKRVVSSAGFAWDREPNPLYEGEYNVNWYTQNWRVKDFPFAVVAMYWEEPRGGEHHDDTDNRLAFYWPTR